MKLLSKYKIKARIDGKASKESWPGGIIDDSKIYESLGFINVYCNTDVIYQYISYWTVQYERTHEEVEIWVDFT